MGFLSAIWARQLESAMAKYLGHVSYLGNRQSIKLPHLHRINSSKNDDCLKDVILEIKNDFMFSSPLVLSGPTTYSIIGEKIYSALENLGLKPQKMIYTDKGLSLETIEKCKKELPDTDCIFAIGGGRIIDLGKALSYQKCTLISVPTALTNDGIASCIASIKEGDKKVSVVFKNPNALLCDYSILKEAPNTSAGIGDAIAKYSSTEDWKLAHLKRPDIIYSETFYQALKFFSQSILAGIKILGKDCIKHEQYTDLLLSAFMVSAAAMSNTGGKTYPASGSEHSLSHAADALFPDREGVLHGEQCGMFTILTSYLQGNDWKTVKKPLKIIGAPTTLKEIKVPDSAITKIFENADRPDRYTILNEKSIEQKIKAAKQVGII